MYNEQCTMLYDAQCTQYVAHCTLYSVHYTTCIVDYDANTVYTVRRTLYTVYTVYRTLYTVYTVHCTPYTVRRSQHMAQYDEMSYNRLSCGSRWSVDGYQYLIY